MRDRLNDMDVPRERYNPTIYWVRQQPGAYLQFSDESEDAFR